MSFWNKLAAELVDIIEWLDPTSDTMVYRFGRYKNEIKYGAKLIVREGQTAVFVNQGRLADVFDPGTYTLATRNLPLLATLQGWHHGFESPFKAEVYFASTRQFTNLKWGTKNPVTLRDAEFGPVRLRAFGTYVIRVSDPARFIREIVGTDGHFTTDDITAQLRDMIVARFGDILGESRIPVLDLAANYDELGAFLANRIQAEFAAYGLELTKLLVENVSLPPEVEEALDKRTSMGIVGNLSQYTHFQTANAIRDAAANESGAAGAGLALGMGFAVANQMGHTLAPGAAPPSCVPPPLPGQSTTYWVAINGAPSGPHDLTTCQQQIQTGVISPTTLVWKPGMPGWTPAEQVPEIRALFAAVPPPLP
jgi:membrane protease subunit (stomatin/prohibitin family)